MEAYAGRLDVDKIRAAYDLAAEAHAGRPDMEARFAKEVTTIVDGVTKLGRVQFQDPDAYEKVYDLMVMRVLTLSPTS